MPGVQGNPGPLGGSIIGAAGHNSAAALIAASDIRVKENIDKDRRIFFRH
jgi:hypothetical protein